MLLLGVAVACVVAFLAILVVLNIRLVVRPFVRIQSLLLSFLRTFIIRIWLAIRSIDLYLL